MKHSSLQEARLLYTEFDETEKAHERFSEHLLPFECDDEEIQRLSSFSGALSGFDKSAAIQTGKVLEKITDEVCSAFVRSLVLGKENNSFSSLRNSSQALENPPASPNDVHQIIYEEPSGPDLDQQGLFNTETTAKQTTIEQLEDVLKEMYISKRESRRDEEARQKFTRNLHQSVRDAIEMNALNELQAKAFSLVAEQFLLRLVSSSKHVHRKRNMIQPFTLYIGGEGGTRKTRIIEALKRFCKSWGKEDAIRCVAPTGNAAALINGQTVHPLLGLSVEKSPNMKRRMPQKLKDNQFETLLLILDEISMLSRRLLGALDKFFRDVKENDMAFGGIIVVLCGDFYQIPPVASDPVYLDPKHSNRRTGLLDTLGYQIWRNLDHVILLEVSMRHKEDTNYADCLCRVRKGLTTREDLEYLNRRVLNRKLLHELGNIKNDNVHMVVRSDDLRMAITWRSVEYYSLIQGQRPFVCVAGIANAAGMHPKPHDLDALFASNDAETNNLLLILPLVIGMPIRITQNISVPQGIANGTDGILDDVEFSNSNRFEEALFFGVTCRLCSELPAKVYIRSDRFQTSAIRTSKSRSSTKGFNTVAIEPVVREGVSSRKLLMKLSEARKIRIRQCPMVPSFASTTYKIQGKTASAVVAFPFLKGLKGPPPNASLYVVLSRVRRHSSLFLTEAIQPEDLKYFKPSKDLVEEDVRLKALHEKTLRSIERFTVNTMNTSSSIVATTTQC